MFRFVQLEFPWVLGPPDGRYVVRGHAGEPTHILVVMTLGAPQRRFLRDRRARSATAEPDPEPVPTTRATLVAAQPLTGDDAGRSWLEGADLDAEATAAVAALNDVLAAHRVATADPLVREVAQEQALVVRVGIGAGEEVAHGRWTKALQAPRPKRPRAERHAAALRPHERLAALLGGRDVALACEELTLRARLDFDCGRHREAALQLRVALEAALAELQAWTGRQELRERLADLRDARSAVGAAANRALEGGLDDATIAEVGQIIARLEVTLRARVATGSD